MSRHLYFDYAATCPLSDTVEEAMRPFWRGDFANASASYSQGRIAAQAIAEARTSVAAALDTEAETIVFTSSATESINLAIKGVAFAAIANGFRPHILSCSTEHLAVLNTCKQLERIHGCRVTLLPVDSFGILDPKSVRDSIVSDTCLVSVMCGNNEIGSLHDVEAIAAICSEAGVLFHCDAVQACGWMELSVCKLGLPLVSVSSHKIGGPKGAGALVVRTKAELVPLVCGGGQEFGLRSGTQNVPNIVGFGKAAQLVSARRGRAAHVITLRDLLLRRLTECMSGVRLTGHPLRRLPNHLSLIVDGTDPSLLMQSLDSAGIFVSSGSACAAQNREHSHVMTAIGELEKTNAAAIRITLGPETTVRDVEDLVAAFPVIVNTVRNQSYGSHW